ncbi:MAG: hypothetical protein M3Y83_09035 [Actinomycetota bacterium]|nr:hypothetical protein [Actinomycetota bacterium]
MTSAGDPEARVVGPEIKTDATREAVNALREKLAGHQRETREQFASVHHEFSAVRSELSELRRETRANIRSVEEHFAEIRDLIVNGRGGR